MIAASPVACVSSFKFLTMQIYPSGSLARNCGPFYPRPPCSQTSCTASAGELSPSDLVLWHLADIRGAATFCPLLDQSGQRSILGHYGLSAYDPTATLAVHCGMDLMPVSAPIKVLV